MKVLIVDDERNIIAQEERVVGNALQKIFPQMDFQIDTCMKIQDAINLIDNNIYTLIFSDIEMPKMRGIDFCELVEKKAPHSNFFFVTGFDNYSIEAWETFACGYLLKPLTEEAVINACRRVRYSVGNSREAKLEIKCFGSFEVRCGNEYITFSRKKSLEMLAVLVDRLGSDTSIGQIRLYLWDEADDTNEKKAYVRQLARDIRSTLSSYGLDDILINTVGGYRLNKDKIDCDYFNKIEEGIAEKPSVYMAQYDWAKDSNEWL